MYRIRFHGRGGQGMKTASRILGSAFFLEGFEVQDAPRYGAERRGAPIFAYVRACHDPINERGIIRRPDLVIVADDTLIPIPAAGVLAGLDERSVLLINSRESEVEWRNRLNLAGPILSLPASAEVEDRAELRYVGATCAGAAARLVGVIEKEALDQAIRDELAELGPRVVEGNRARALEAYHAMQEHSGCVAEGVGAQARDYQPPKWIELALEEARISAPDIHGAATSEKMPTGLWRTMRPVIDYDHCNRCWWVCSTFCPDSAIRVDEEGHPQIDYEHCKGCLICVAQCPPHAIRAIAEQEAQAEEQ